MSWVWQDGDCRWRKEATVQKQLFTHKKSNQTNGETQQQKLRREEIRPHPSSNLPVLPPGCSPCPTCNFDTRSANRATNSSYTPACTNETTQEMNK